jgi:hypothetical protein
MGRISEFFGADHRRLDSLLQKAAAQGGEIELTSFGQFRAGLLKHIGMEEKILLPAARNARGGSPLPIARRLHLDHGAIASLLVPTPTPAVVEKLLAMLRPHNTAEEEPGGLYEQCDALLPSESAAIIERLRAFPEVALAPFSDGPLVELTIENAIRRARESW